MKLTMLMLTATLLCCLATGLTLASPCTNVDYHNGVGYSAAPDCRYFYQCEDYGRTYTRQACANGTYWSQQDLTCTPLRASCSPDTPVTTVNAEAGYVARCDGSKKAASGSPGWYMEQVHGNWLKRPCPAGTRFQVSNCTCVNGGPITYSPCTAELDIPFETSVKDESGKGVYIENSKVKVKSGRGYFYGSRLRINRFSNVDFGSTVTFSFQMEPVSKGTTRGRVIVGNSDCKKPGSVVILQQRDAIQFMLYNKKTGAQILNVPYKYRAGVKGQVTLRLRDGVMTASVGGTSRQTAFKGSVASVPCALHVGQSSGYDDYFGYLDNLEVSYCK